ncbi:L,D-transpeptidase [Nocardioides convexus]|uniref:L,D-transpeptidase n=1 Tax=Nocardioides convexus TaxID=2712224 RepID=UPI002418A02B|nr:L,D-transpeptidase [Nocardioides convexus]
MGATPRARWTRAARPAGCSASTSRAAPCAGWSTATSARPWTCASAPPSPPTREGVFAIERKSRDHVSSLYHTPMPYAMFFSRGQAVHYSSDFAARGYNGASHGCVNVRDKDAVAWLFDQVQARRQGRRLLESRTGLSRARRPCRGSRRPRPGSARC